MGLSAQTIFQDFGSISSPRPAPGRGVVLTLNSLSSAGLRRPLSLSTTLWTELTYRTKRCDEIKDTGYVVEEKKPTPTRQDVHSVYHKHLVILRNQEKPLSQQSLLCTYLP